MRRLLLVAAVGIAALAVGTSASGATRECDGFMICLPRAGPWVAVSTSGAVPRPRTEWQLSCPRGYIVGGLDAELSQRGIDVWFRGTLGSPVNPGITTAKAVVFVGSYVGATARSPSFRPHVGCIPASGGGTRVPTAAGVVPAGHPTTRRVRTVRVRPGSSSVTATCLRRERLVEATHAFGFYTRRPPSASLVGSVTGSLAVSGGRAIVTVRGDAEIASVRAVVQVQAVCARIR